MGHQVEEIKSGQRHLGLQGIISDRLFWRGSFPWVVAIFAVLNVMVLYWHGSIAEERRKNLLVTQERAPADGARWDMSAGGDLGRYWPSIPDARSRPLVILAGMSQMYAINDARPKDETISEHMDDALSPRGIRVFGMAAPNLSNEEAVLLLLSTLSDPRTRPAVFNYGVCFDKFRNIDLRLTFPPQIGPRCVNAFETDSRRRLACRRSVTVPNRSSPNYAKLTS